MNTVFEREFSRPGNEYMIEETKKTCTDCIHYEICSLWATTDLDEDEAYKYCFGRYRSKIPENAVVLTREEYDEFLRQNFIIDMLKDCIKDARKEMAKKVMEDCLKDTLTISTRDYGSIEVVPLDRINEICENIIKGDKQ